MKIGKVIRFGARGFGFIEDSSDRRAQYFFHLNDVEGRRVLLPSDIVSYDIQESAEKPRTPRAVNVRLLKPDEIASVADSAKAAQ